MLSEAIIPVCFEIYTKHVKALSGQSAEFLNLLNRIIKYHTW
jgi:hypothetical protein